MFPKEFIRNLIDTKYIKIKLKKDCFNHLESGYFIILDAECFKNS